MGLGTRVLEVGDPTCREAVVLLHGVPGSADHWSDLLTRLEPHGRAVAFDLPAWGEADGPDDWDYTSNGYAMFVTGALHELGVDRAHLVLHDLGGVGLSWAAAHPDAVATVTLLNTGIFLGVPWHPVARLFRAPIVGRMTERAGRFLFCTVLGYFEGGRVSKQVIENGRREYDRAARRSLLRYYRATPMTAIERLAPVLRRIEVPALIVWGGRDRFFPPSQATRQRESFPSARVHVLPDSGHFAHLDDPDGVADLVLPFLREHLMSSSR